MAFPPGKKAPAFGSKKAPAFGAKKAPAFGAKKAAAPTKGDHTPIKRYPGQEESAPAKGAKTAERSTSLGGQTKATPEPKLSPEAEAARANQGAVTIITAKGPATAPPPDPRASYQVGEAEDNTPLFSFTAVASAAARKGQPSGLVPPTANSDLTGAEDEEAPEDEEEEDVPAKKSPFGRK